MAEGSFIDENSRQTRNQRGADSHKSKVADKAVDHFYTSERASQRAETTMEPI
jgi:hypothetical protein